MSQTHHVDDFHTRREGSAPEWRQRYVQLSSGRMRSRLTGVTSGPLQIYRKWMSERVVQQGGLPVDRICFAVLARPMAETPRMQGAEFTGDRIFILRGGDDFSIQRPRGMEMLSAVFEMEAFRRLGDEAPWSPTARGLLRRSVVDGAPTDVARLRALLSRTDASIDHAAVMGLLGGIFDSAGEARSRPATLSASALVARCHRLVIESGDQPPSIEALCARLGVSRRTLQNSFMAVAGESPLAYLRSVRLGAARAQLRAGDGRTSVTEVALAHGFTHLGRFAGDYKALFGESPSESVVNLA